MFTLADKGRDTVHTSHQGNNNNINILPPLRPTSRILRVVIFEVYDLAFARSTPCHVRRRYGIDCHLLALQFALLGHQWRDHFRVHHSATAVTARPTPWPSEDGAKTLVKVSGNDRIGGRMSESHADIRFSACGDSVRRLDLDSASGDRI